LFATAISRIPSPLKSAVTIPTGFVPTPTVDDGVDGYTADISLGTIGIKITFDFPPPGAGLITAMEPTPTAAAKESGTEAVSFLELTNVVDSEAPFHVTREEGTNSAPSTVSVTPVAPGDMLTGDTISMNGTGLGAATAFVVVNVQDTSTTTKRRRHVFKRCAFAYRRAIGLFMNVPAFHSLFHIPTASTEARAGFAFLS
jgi:hypothetical protein